jgi:GR25 family glycosyltransferase involved in LPS biosynthesis
MISASFSDLNKLFPWKSCISLRHTPHRTIEARKEFDTHGVTNVTFYIADKSDNPIEGCYMSHLNVMKQALMDNVDYALVFEDDVKFNDNLKNIDAIMKEIKHFISNNKFDIFYLGWCAGYDSYFFNCIRKSTKLPNYSYIYNCHCACTHALVYSKDFMQRFVRDYGEFNYGPWEGHIDQVFLKIPDIKMFMVVPTIFDQKWCFSVMDYGKSKCTNEKIFSAEKFANYVLEYKQNLSYYLIGIFVLLIFIFLYLSRNKLTKSKR